MPVSTDDFLYYRTKFIYFPRPTNRSRIARKRKKRAGPLPPAGEKLRLLPLKPATAWGFLLSLNSTIHGAGRVMSRTPAAGKAKFVSGRKVRVSPGQISREMMLDWVTGASVVLRGVGTDESPHIYKRLPEMIQNHSNTRITHTLRPIGVAMAGDEFDPYKD